MNTDAALRTRLDEIFAARDRGHMAPTIAAFLEVLAGHPDDPAMLYEGCDCLGDRRCSSI